MKYDPQKHHRHSIRLDGYDYSQAGAYFVTICAHQREELFGQVESGIMHLNGFGKIVQSAWTDLPHHYPLVEIEPYCVMSNHIHGVVVLPPEPPDTEVRQPLSEIVRAFKSFSAARINQIRNAKGRPVWQRNYYEHIIRSTAEWQKIADYIHANPQRWAADHLHPANPAPPGS